MPVWPDATLNAGTFTDCVLASGDVRFGKSSGFDDFFDETKYTVVAGGTTWMPPETPFGVSISYTGGAGENNALSINNSSLGNGTVLGRLKKSAATSGGMGLICRRAQGNNTFYALVIDTTQITIYKVSAGGYTNLGSTAGTFNLDTWFEPRLSFNGGTITGIVGTTRVTITGASLDGGTIGIWANPSGAGGYVLQDYCYALTTATTATYVSPTLDLGSAQNVNSFGWSESLDGGDATYDLSIRTGRGAANNFTITGLATPLGSDFASTSGQFINFRANLTRNRTNQNVGVKNHTITFRTLPTSATNLYGGMSAFYGS